jgi:hypothetical protein
MRKKFTITGRVFPAENYMADVSGKMKQVLELVENGEYFIINRPRQYGKTTTLNYIFKALSQMNEYIVFSTSFEGIGDTFFETEVNFVRGFVRLLAKKSKNSAPDLLEWLKQVESNMNNLDDISDMITELVNRTNKKVVLIIDEVDKSSNNQLFVNFLAMLRDKYLEREEAPTFHSVVLAGVHDVKSLKIKLRPDEEKKLNSPWNIATEFKVDMNLNPHEIKPMLDEYASDKGVTFDTQAIADRLFYLTSGYPFLVSKLCKMLDEDLEPTCTTKVWTVESLNNAFKELINGDGNANFDSLRKNLLDNSDLYQFISAIIMDGRRFEFSVDNILVELGIVYGIVSRSKDNKVQIHNRVYRERIANMMISIWQTDSVLQSKYDPDAYNYRDQFVRPDNSLDIELILLKFQAFMKEQYTKKDRKFLEKHGRLVFLAFLRPIINGAGFDFKEPQISEERRLDVVITHFQHKYVAELKIWRGDAAHEKGLIQLTDYLEKENLSDGFLLIFDHSVVKKWHSETIEKEGKKIFIAWV